MTPASRSIVKSLDVIKNIDTSQVLSFVDALTYTLLLQKDGEEFSYRVIPAIASKTHARKQFIGIIKALSIISAVLAILI